jgi:group I intron endonuclease
MSKLLNYVYDASLLEYLTKKGVYKISHISKEGIFYIGSASGNRNVKACQKGFYRRFLEHLYNLEHKKHDSKYLQNVVNKYGIEGIRFEILEIVETEDRNIILEREQYYLDLLSPAYNSSKIAKCPTVPYTAERKQAASDRRKGKKFPDSVYDAVKVPIFQFSKKGILVKKYDSGTQASKETNIDRASINNTALGKRKSAGGYLWSFKNFILLEHKNIIYQYTLEDQFIRTFDTLEEIKRKLNINTSTAIRNCFSGKQKQAYGFKWVKQ